MRELTTADHTPTTAAVAPAPVTAVGPVALMRFLQQSAGNQAAGRVAGVQPLDRPVVPSRPRSGDAVLSRALSDAAGGRIARCACGGVLGSDGECEECKRKRGGTLARSPLQRHGPDTPADPAATIVAAVKADDVGAAVGALRGKPPAELGTLRATVNGSIPTPLERWLARRRGRAAALDTMGKALGVAGGLVSPVLGTATVLFAGAGGGTASADEGLRLLWPALTLVERLQVYDEGWRELEQAQIDVIKSATLAERKAARGTPELDQVFRRMDAKEEFEARRLIDDSPEATFFAAERLLLRAPGVFADEEDAVFDALLALPRARRKQFYDQHRVALADLLTAARLTLLKTVAEGTEAQAIIARLRQATEGRVDDKEGIQKAVDRALELLKERATLKAVLAQLPASEKAAAEARLKELDDLDQLLQFKRGKDGALDANSFMGMLSDARGDAGAFGADAAKLGAFSADGRQAFEAAKQRILLAADDVQAIRAAIVSIKDQAQRRELLADPDVKRALAKLPGSDQKLVGLAVTAGPYEELLVELNDAFNGARWGTFFHLVHRIAANDDWRTRFQQTRNEVLSTYSKVRGEELQIMETILKTQRVPIDAILAFSGEPAVLKTALQDIGEDERGQLRLGFSLANQPGPHTEEQTRALAAFKHFEERLRKSQTTLKVSFDNAGFQEVLFAVLGSAPTKDELGSGEGRFRAAEIMYAEQRARMALRRGGSAEFTETDETMEAAAREFAARFEPLRAAGKLTTVDFAALTTLHDRFQHRSDEFQAASDAVSEMAGMIAATVAGLVVVAATGGTATPAVIALAAAAGGGARVVTQEMFGEDFNKPDSRQAILGAVDGALAVVGASLAAKGAEFVGLGGRALVTGAARGAGQAAEQASASLARKIGAGAVESAIDGAFSGAVSQAFGTMTDPSSWRRGIWAGLVRVGQDALLAGLVGLGTGGLVGAAMPVAGAAGKRLMGAVAGQAAIERKLAEAGAGDLLAQARKAAKAGDVKSVDNLVAQLEKHLAADEVSTLRRQLDDDLTAALNHPPGRAELLEGESKLLGETRALEGTQLSPEQRAAEIEIVARSEPRVSAEPGFVDEVELGNGHVWRRKSDGTWCRFSAQALCGTKIPKAKPMSPAAEARRKSAQFELDNVYGSRDKMERDKARLPGLRQRVLDAPRLPGGKLDFDVLSAEEREVLEQIFSSKELSDVTPIELRRGEAIVDAELAKTVTAEAAALKKLKQASRSLLEWAHTVSPRRVRNSIIARSRGLDELTGELPRCGELGVDHVVSMKRITDDPVFQAMDEMQQIAVLNEPKNLVAIDRRANESKSDWSFSDWPNRRRFYGPEALAKAAERQAEAEAEIARLLAKK